MIELEILATTPSTMEEARARLAAGDTTTQAVLALEQTQGRGRLGRPWQTFPAPYGMACTFIVRQPCAHLPLLMALSVLQALQAEGAGEGVALKWPNDVLHNGRKLAGILCEGLNERQFLVGIGMNLLAPQSVPPSFDGAFLGSAAGPEHWAQAIGTCIFRNLDLYSTQGWAAFHHNYAHACSTFGQRITWRGPAGNDELTGLARGLNDAGHLKLVMDDGTVRVIHSGEIVSQAIA